MKISKCNCKEDIIKRYTTLLEKEGVKGVRYVIFENTCLLSGKFAMRLKYDHTHTFKNGNQKVKEASVLITATYCPFCGEKYEEKTSTTTPN